MAQVVAYDREICLIGLQVFEFAEFLVGAAVGEVAAQGIYGISGVDDDATAAQAPDYLCDQPVIYIVGIDMDQHGSEFL